MPPFHGKHIQRILIVKPSSLGDIMHTFPAMLLLRRRFPHAKMDWMINPAFADAVLYSPFPVRQHPGAASHMPSFPICSYLL